MTESSGGKELQSPCQRLLSSPLFYQSCNANIEDNYRGLHNNNNTAITLTPEKTGNPAQCLTPRQTFQLAGQFRVFASQPIRTHTPKPNTSIPMSRLSILTWQSIVCFLPMALMFGIKCHLFTLSL